MSDAARSPVKVGDVIDGKYRIDRVLGAGGMGIVVVATHLQLEQKCAIKFLLPAVAKTPEAVARFAREARASAKIQSEHVVRVLDVATQAGSPYMVMEYLEGHDLEMTLEEHKVLPVEHGIDYVLQALEALAEAHVAGIVHRDLKPANIFLARRADGSSVVKVLDFGISKLAGDTAKLTSESAQMGSPLYMSPEQLRRTRDVDARADIWAVGVILQELLTGEAPFMAESLAEIVAGILSLPPLRMRLHNPEIPATLEAVVLKCLEKDPDQRFPDVAQLAVALTPFAPERSRVSIERIVRVIGGRKEISLPPSSTNRASATQAGLEASTKFVDPVAPAQVAVAAPAEPPPEQAELEPQSTAPSWRTTGARRLEGRSRVMLMGVGGLVGIAAVATVILLSRSSGPAAPASAAKASATTTADTPPPPLVPAVIAADPTSAPAVPSASASTAPSSAPAKPVRPTSTAAVATPPTAGPPKPAPDDFGGRK